MMTFFFEIIITGLSCFLLTIILVPLSIKAANLIGALDYPGKLKIHSDPIPRIGGLAIFSSIILISFLFPSIVSRTHSETMLFISFSAGGIFLLGVLDDLKNLKFNIKLLFQMINIFLAVTGLFTLVGSLNIVYFTLIVIFILGLTNAFNLIDGIDGLASGIAFFIALGLLMISLLCNQQFIILSASLIMGASLGFLIFNSNPAKIFLGDCGSTFLGFFLGILISIIWLNSTNKLVLLPLLIIAGIPICDTSSAILRRSKLRKSIFMGDRDHLYDLIIQKGFTIKQTVLIFYAISLFLTIIGIILFYLIEF